jgi:hypothetical protein
MAVAGDLKAVRLADAGGQVFHEQARIHMVVAAHQP